MIPSGKYARIEIERRFLLTPMKTDIVAFPSRAILDHYITDTNLRLRQMENGDEKIYKFAKKLKVSPGREEITTIYLSSDEYQLLSKLPAVVVRKVRYIVQHGEVTIGIDIYGKEQDRLWLAEVEFETEEQMKEFAMPIPYQIEVTGNDEFSGFALASRFGQQNRQF